jgi:predicted DNA-binding transcriptional regulator AlpA
MIFRKRQQNHQRKRPAFVLSANLHDSQVLKFPEWCDAAGFSQRTGRRILSAGTGPAVVRLSDKRMGVTVGAHRQWLASRERVGAAR